MTDLPTPSPIVDWGWAGLGLDGDISGDMHTVVLLRQAALLAVTDGLGHGPEAAAASAEAATILQAHAERPLQDLVELCHDALRKTRGVVMSLVYLDARSRTLDWCGIGNVEGVLLRGAAGGPSSEAITNRGGVVGYRLPSVRVTTLPVFPGDVVILASDGIRSGFASGIDVGAAPQAIADAVFARHARTTDDALVLVARYLGETR